MSKNVASVTILITALVIGFAAGIGGEFVSRYYLSNIGLFRDLYLPAQNTVGSKEIIIQEAKKVVVEEEQRVSQVTETARKSVFGVYTKRRLTAPSVADRYYTSADQLSQAVPLTSDGWLVTQYAGTLVPLQIVVAQEDRILEVDRVVHDASTNIWFLKVAATDLPVIEFASSDALVPGQGLLTYDVAAQAVQLARIADLVSVGSATRAESVRTVEEYTHRVRIDRALAPKLSGAPLLNYSGEIVAIATGDDGAIGTSYVHFLLRSLLKDDKLTRPYLGLHFIQTQDLIGYESDKTAAIGALVVKGANGVAVAKDSPLAGKVSEGDVITAIEGITLTGGRDFADTLYTYRLGSSVTFTVVRGAETLDVEYEVIGR